jgi:hypothetical protein
MELVFQKEGVGEKRADMVAKLEARKAEQQATKESRAKNREQLQLAQGGTTNVARSSEEFWTMFNASVKSALRPHQHSTPPPPRRAPLPPPSALTHSSARHYFQSLLQSQSCAGTWTAQAAA